jgi:hypothetical protein
MGEANRTLIASLLDNDGLEYNTYTRAELDARRAEFKAARASQTPGAIRDRARRAKLKATEPNYLNKEALRKRLIRANNPGMTRASFKSGRTKTPIGLIIIRRTERVLPEKASLFPLIVRDRITLTRTLLIRLLCIKMSSIHHTLPICGALIHTRIKSPFI